MVKRINGQNKEIIFFVQKKLKNLARFKASRHQIHLFRIYLGKRERHTESDLFLLGLFQPLKFLSVFNFH